MNTDHNQTNVVTRMPPSPTGHLHIGTVRTALFNYLFAEHYEGEMILRSEDTDKTRSTKEFETEIIDGLKLLGLSWSNKNIYRQSERASVYRTYLEKMIENDSAYISKEESVREPGTFVEIVRLRNPNKTITFMDLVRGEISFDTTELGDMVIARSIDDALYHFTVVVDDHEMKVTHVLRGEDHISNTPRQILIQEALGFDRPQYAHLPLILAPDKSKMSKRHGAVALYQYLDDGYLPEAILNYLALLGWNPGNDQEIFNLEELVKVFSLDHVQKSGAVFDIEKFKWFNKAHLEKLSDDKYTEYVISALPEEIKKLPKFSDERLQKLMPTIKERIHIAKEITEAAKVGEYDFAFSDPEIDLDLLKWKKDNAPTDSLPRLLHAVELLKSADFSSPESIKSAVWGYAEEIGRGELLWPLRVALTGLERSPDPFTSAYIIGQVDTLKRLDTVCDKMMS